MVHVCSLITLVGYAVAVVAAVQTLFKDSKIARQLLRSSFLIGLVAHIALVVPFLFLEEYRFLKSGADYFFWLSLAVAIAYQLFRQKIDYPVLGVFLVSASLLFLASSSYLMHASPLQAFDREMGALLGFHVLPAIIAEACLVIASGLSAVFLMQERRLKGKQTRLLQFKGPSLEWLEKGSRVALGLGFAAMTFAILSGCIWAYAIGTSLIRPDVSVIVALLSWLALGYIQVGKFVQRWSARRMSIVTVVSTISIVVAFFFLRLVSGVVMHGYSGI